MNRSGRTILKNAGFLLISQVVTWGLSLITMIVLPRYLGVEVMGEFNLAGSLWAITAVLVTFGIDLMLTKEVAQAPERLSSLFGTAVVLRLAFLFTAFIGLAMYAGVFYTREVLVITAILGLNALFLQVSGVVQACLQGLERMGPISIVSMVSQLVGTAAILAAVILKQDFYTIAFVSTSSGLLAMLLMYVSLRRVAVIRFQFDRSLARQIIKISYPYLIAQLFIILYQQVDVVVMSWLVDVRNIGWYSAADRLFGTLLFVPTIFASAAYPTLSKLLKENYLEFLQMVRRSFHLMLLIGVPVGLGVLVVGTPFSVLLYGEEFAKSGPVLDTLGIVLIFMYLNILFGQTLICLERQRALTIVMALATLTTIPLDLIFVPLCTRLYENAALGGALSFIVTEFSMTIVMIFLLPRSTLGMRDIEFSVRVFLAGTGMLAIVWLFRDLFLLVPIVVGVVTYVALIFALRVLPREELLALQEIAKSMLGRVRNRISPANLPGSN